MSLDDSLDNSRTEFTRRGTEVYWQGLLVGNLRFATATPNEKILAQIRSLNVPVYQEFTGSKLENFNNFQYIITYIKNNKGLHVLTIIQRNAVKQRYDQTTKQWFTEVFHTDHFIVDIRTNRIEHLPGKQYTSDSAFSAWMYKYRNYFSTEPRNSPNFERNKKLTLERGTITEPDTWSVRFNAGYSYFNITRLVIMNSSLKFDVKKTMEPIHLAFIDLGVYGFGLFFKIDYITDFGRGTGSYKESRNVDEELNLKSEYSYFLKLAAGIFGLETRYTLEEYTAGTITYTYDTTPLDNSDNTTESMFIPFVTTKTQVDILYHVAWKDIPELGGKPKRTWINDFYFGYRYFDFETITVGWIESFKGKSEDEDGDVIAESFPQKIRYKLHLFGIGGTNLHMRSTGILYDLEAFIGGGKSKFDFSNYYSLNEEMSKHGLHTGEKNYTVLSMQFGVALGARYSTNNNDLSIFGYYRFEGVGLGLSKWNDENKDYALNTLDDSIYFHSAHVGIDFIF
jgi:hypothetical protein